MLSHSSASSTWRSCLIFFGVFFSLKKLSQLDVIELARCPWARAMCLSELDGAEPARCSWASSQKFPNVLNCQVQSPLITLVLDMVPLKKPKVTVKTYPWWNWASYMFWASSKKWKIVNSTIQFYTHFPTAHRPGTTSRETRQETTWTQYYSIETVTTISAIPLLTCHWNIETL